MNNTDFDAQIVDMGSGFLGNPKLKRQNTRIAWTQEMIEEYARCAEHPLYFAKKYMQIVHVDRGLTPFVPYKYQEEIINSIHDNRFTIVCTSRQSGKTTSLIAYALWYVLF